MGKIHQPYVVFHGATAFTTDLEVENVQLFRQEDAYRFFLINAVLPLLLMAAVFSAWGTSVNAAPASPRLSVLTQPDGTTFAARRWGDEWLNGWETESGQAIVFDEFTRSWVYAVPGSGGRLIASSKVVAKDRPPLGLKSRLRPTGAAFRASLARKPVFSPAKINRPRGTGNILTILINFADRKVTYGRPAFEALLFGKNNRSMADYFTEVSYGQFSVSAGPAGVRGWYSAPRDHNYYTYKVGDLIVAAVKAADDEGVNFAPYDQDGDCVVDAVNVIHQGRSGATGGDGWDIWSHRWTLEKAYNWGSSNYQTYITRTPCSKGGFIRVNDYVIGPELLYDKMITMGIFAHEYGHILGLPDLYDNDGDSYGAGIWSLMSEGMWNNTRLAGDTPAHLDPWSKFKLGWISPTKITSSTPSIHTIYPAATHASVFQFGDGDPASATGEYFLVENRQQLGFDSYPWFGGGMVIWHVDERKDWNNEQCYPGGPSCADHHYKVAVVQADGLWQIEKNLSPGDDGDVFPGSSGNTSFNDDTTPSARFYSGARSGIRISSIALSGLNVTASMARGAAPQSLDLSYIQGGSGKGSVSFSPKGTVSSCSANCANSYPRGTVVTLTALAQAGSVFAGWSGAGCSGRGTCRLTMSSAQSVSAIFNTAPPASFVLSYARAGSGRGTASFAPAGSLANCAENCTNSYVAGRAVTLTAVPQAGSVFTGWSGAGCSGTGPCAITMSQARAVTASFRLLPVYNLSYFKLGAGAGTVSFSSNGTASSCVVNCVKSYPSGARVTLTATPASGSVFAGWSGPVCRGKATCTVTISLAQFVTARFNPARSAGRIAPGG